MPFGSLGGLLHPKKTERKKEVKKEAPTHSRTPILETSLAYFFDDFSVYFSVRFLDYFWSDFGAILGPKVEQKSLKNQSKIRSNFWVDF